MKKARMARTTHEDRICTTRTIWIVEDGMETVLRKRGKRSNCMIDGGGGCEVACAKSIGFKM